MTMPQYAVSKWIGHSITVSGRHYANHVPDELFERASELEGRGANSAQQNAQQKAHETSGNGMKRQPAADEISGRSSRDFQSLRESSSNSHSGEKWSRGDSNPRANAKSSKKGTDSQRSAAPGAVPRAEDDFDVRLAADAPGLRRVIAAWHELPDAVRKGIVAMVEASMREK